MNEKIQHLKAELAKLRVWLKMSLSAFIGGGLASLYMVVHDGVNEIYTKAGQLHMKHAFISGGLLALLLHLAPSPIKPPEQKQ